MKKTMKCGYECQIVEYNSSTDIKVMFLHNREVRNASYGNFKKGNIRTYNTPLVLGIGVKGNYFGDNDGKIYRCWSSMLSRCYNKNYQKNHETYKDCIVAEEWLYFPNFAKWYVDNYYELEGLGRTDLDKDILIKGNKVYSPDTCIFVPEKINKIFTKVNKSRGNCLIGVSYHKQNKKYTAHCNRYITGEKEYIGSYNSEIEAFNSYKKSKEEYISKICNMYKYLIPEPLFNALLLYRVDIND